MKKGIHPSSSKINVICGCGNKFIVFSVFLSEFLFLDVCNKCHPFFTGKKKLVDTAGRVEVFNKRFNKQFLVKENNGNCI